MTLEKEKPKKEIKKKRVIAYYDGSNFYHHVKGNYGITNVHFLDMTNQIIKLDCEEVVKIKYFNCPINQQEDATKYANQQKFFVKLDKTPFMQKYLGNLVKRPLNRVNINCPTCGHQKCDVLKY
ncbi:MAG: hypothetical protein U9R34_01695 [Nanoarchaeota archaeon]|nr:hypothetical protein [Nanoarchaeota archaeon]